MKTIDVNYLPRNKSLDETINNIQKRMATFKTMHMDDLFNSNPDTTIDYNISGREWVRLSEDKVPENHSNFAVFAAGTYKISPQSFANILVSYDIVDGKIKGILAEVD